MTYTITLTPAHGAPIVVGGLPTPELAASVALGLVRSMAIGLPHHGMVDDVLEVRVMTGVSGLKGNLTTFGIGVTGAELTIRRT